MLASTESALTGVLAFAFFVAYMSTENYLIQPAVVGKAVNLSPPTGEEPTGDEPAEADATGDTKKDS